MVEFRFTKHALERMFQRGISPENCIEVFHQSHVIENYPDDRPFPSQLMVGKIGNQVIHIVAALNGNITHIITAYFPTPELWNNEYSKRA